MTPEEQYKKETGKDIYKINSRLHTDEYVEWIKKYAQNSNDIGAKIFRKFAHELKK